MLLIATNGTLWSQLLMVISVRRDCLNSYITHTKINCTLWHQNPPQYVCRYCTMLENNMTNRIEFCAHQKIEWKWKNKTRRAAEKFGVCAWSGLMILPLPVKCILVYAGIAVRMCLLNKNYIATRPKWEKEWEKQSQNPIDAQTHTADEIKSKLAIAKQILCWEYTQPHGCAYASVCVCVCKSRMPKCEKTKCTCICFYWMLIMRLRFR